MTDLSKKTVLFHDLAGSYTHIASAVAPFFGRTLYYNFHEHAFPSMRDYLPGVGLDGIERVPDFDNALAHADLVVFPDVGRAGLQERLRREGFPVWGGGRGCQLEQDRIALKTVLKECGLPVGKWSKVEGVEALRAFFAHRELADGDPRCFIKMSYWRGDCETEKVRSYFGVRGWIDDIAVRLGPGQYDAVFIVEEPIDDGDDGPVVEVGIDGAMAAGVLLRPTLFGYEDKDKGLLGTTAALPERLDAVYEQLSPLLKEINYCGPFSVEVRCTRDADHVIDWTSRYPSPPSEAQCKVIENLAEIMYQGAHGVAVVPVYKAPLIGQLVLESEDVMEHALPLSIGRPDAVAIHGHCRVEGCDYAISPARIKQFGGAVGMGSTLQEVVEDCLDAADSVEGSGVEYDSGAFRRIMDSIREGEELGMPWGRLTVERAA